MKILVAIAAVVVMATCGYFVYDNIQTKEAIEQRADLIRCRSSLNDIKDMPAIRWQWEGKTHEQRVKLVRANYGELFARLLEINWEECGPV